MKYVALVYNNPGAFEAMSPGGTRRADERGRRVPEGVQRVRRAHR